MSTAPSRTRSIRKPGTGTNSQYTTSSTHRNSAADTARQDEDLPSRERREVKSPSRLPVKPFTSNAPSGLSRTSSISRKASVSSGTTTSNAPSGLSRTTSISRKASINGGSTSMRPPPRSVTTRPPISSENKGPVLRSRAPSESTSNASTSSLQRKPSTSTARHSRNTSTSSISKAPPPRTIHTRSSSTASASTISRPPSQSSREENPSSKLVIGGHSRNISALTASTTLKASTQSTSKSNAVQRPTFSTLQQHYSPAKNLAPKPATATFLVPPSPSKLPSNVAISAETARLQAELLQLHLLHLESGSVQEEWRESARTKLGERFDDVVSRHEALVDKEGDQQFKSNAITLREWQEGSVPGWGLEEKIQALDQVLSGVWKLGEGGGKYSRIVRRFERWLDSVQDIYDSRKQYATHGGQVSMGAQDMAFIEGLETAWTDECQGLRRKLADWRDLLKDLGPVEGGSGLATTVQGCDSLVNGMLEELVVMQRIEGEVVSREREWITDMCNDVSSEDEAGGVSVGATWRRY